MRSIVVYGPQGCGKTRNAVKIQHYFGLKFLRDGFTFGEQLPKTDTLILTNEAPDETFGMHHVLTMRYEKLPEWVRS
jgi:hypothetical protein